MFQVGDRVKIINECSCCKGQQGVVRVSSDTYVEVELDDGRKGLVYYSEELELVDMKTTLQCDCAKCKGG